MRGGLRAAYFFDQRAAKDDATDRPCHKATGSITSAGREVNLQASMRRGTKRSLFKASSAPERPASEYSAS